MLAMQKQVNLQPKIAVSVNKKIKIKGMKKTSSKPYAKKIDIQRHVDMCCFMDDKSGITYEQELKKLFASKEPVNRLWDGVQFNLVNPTNSPCSFNLFDGYPLRNVSNTPNGWVQPPINPITFNPIVFNPQPVYPVTECATVNVTSTLPNTFYAPFAVCYVPSLDRIFAACDDASGQVYMAVVNPNTNVIVNSCLTSLANSNWMSAYCSVNNTVYLTNKSPILSVIDCTTVAETALITLPASAEQVGYSASNNYLYVTVPSLSRVYYIDCATNTIVGFINLSGGAGGAGLTLWTYGGNSYALVMNMNNTTCNLINTTTNTVINTFSVTVAPSINGAQCYNTMKNTIYYHATDSTIKEINMTTLTVMSTSIAIGVDSYCLMYIPAYNTIYADIQQSSKNAYVINCTSNTIVTTIGTSIVNAQGSRFAYDPVNTSVWMTGNATNVIIAKICALDLQCYITGSMEYNEFLQDFKACPKCVRQIMLVTETIEQASVPFEVMERDANGNTCTRPRLPQIHISTDQFQQNIAIVDFNCKDLILDNTFIFSNYTVAANSTVKMVIWFKEICVGSVLSRGETSLCKNSESKCSDGNSRLESELKFQSPRPHTRPDYMKPFSNKITPTKRAEPDTNVNRDLSTINDDVKIPLPKKQIDLTQVTQKKLKQDKQTKCDFEELGRPLFDAELSKNIKKTVVLEDAKPRKITPDTNVGKCEEICSTSDEITYKKIPLDLYYKDAVKNFDVFQNGIKIKK